MSDKIKLLFLGANPRNEGNLPLNLEGEIHNIQEQIKSAKHASAFELILWLELQIGEIQRALLEHMPHILHFSGHGNDSSELKLMDKNSLSCSLLSDDLQTLIKEAGDNIQVVLLNACHSRKIAQELIKEVDFAIGMSDVIDDEAAITFAGAFYRALGFARSVQGAYNLAINALKLEKFQNDATVPKLFVKEGNDPENTFITESLSSAGMGKQKNINLELEGDIRDFSLEDQQKLASLINSISTGTNVNVHFHRVAAGSIKILMGVPTEASEEILRRLNSEKLLLGREVIRCEIKEEDLRKTKEKSPGNKVISIEPRKRRRLISNSVFSAAALIMLSVGALWFYANTAGAPSYEATLTQKTGTVKVQGKELSEKANVPENFPLETAKRSRAELVIKSGQSNLRIVLKSNTVFQFKSAGEIHSPGFQARLSRGRALLDLRLNDKAKKRFILNTPFTQTIVTGTKFSLSAEKKGTRLTVYEGRVKQRLRIKELEQLPPEILDKSPVLREVLTTLENTTREVGSGKVLKLSAADSEKLLHKSPILKAALELPAVKIRRDGERDPEGDRVALVALEEYFQDPARSIALKKNLEKVIPDSLNDAQDVSKEELKEREKNFETVGGDGGEITKAKNEKSVPSVEGAPTPTVGSFPPSNLQGLKKVEWYYQNKKKISLSQIESIMNTKRVIVEYIPTGQKLTGVVKPEGNHLLLLTTHGKRVMNKSTVRIK